VLGVYKITHSESSAAAALRKTSLWRGKHRRCCCGADELLFCVTLGLWTARAIVFRNTYIIHSYAVRAPQENQIIIIFTKMRVRKFEMPREDGEKQGIALLYKDSE